jgi:hypothetical protein
MIRRIVLAVAAAVALTLVPAAAMAYEAPGFTFSVSDATPATGVPFTAVITGAVPGSVVTLTVTGVAGQTLTATANASGAATFTVTLNAAGAYTLTATNAAGAVLGTQVVTVAAAAAAAVPALSSTGFDGMPLAVGGGVLVLAGAGAVVVAKRRKSATVPA